MSVEQTTQLIQLILNAVLMSVACALVLGGLTARHAAISQQLQIQNRSEDLWDGDHGGNRPYQRQRLRRLQHRYQMSRYSVLTAYYALFFAVISCFALALRGLINWNGLIPVALGLFVIGIATLLVAVGLTLVDWHLGDRPLLDEAQHLLSLGEGSSLAKFRQKSRRSGDRSKTSLNRNQKMRVG